jgi:hypothetical protein
MARDADARLALTTYVAALGRVTVSKPAMRTAVLKQL